MTIKSLTEMGLDDHQFFSFFGKEDEMGGRVFICSNFLVALPKLRTLLPMS